MSDREFFLDRYRDLGHTLSGREKTRKAIRLNSLKAPENIIERLGSLGARLSKISFLHNGYYIDGSEFSLGASFEYLMGYYTLQEAASQFVVEVLDPQPGESILDTCAAPGIKTSQIAAHMENKGSITALDINRKRLYVLENSLERMGVENCIAYHGDILELDLGEQLFDRVVIDAPCSGNYVNDSNWFGKRTLNDVERNSENQENFLARGMDLLKPGGVLVYATCSLEPEENELNIDWLLEYYDAHLETFEGPGSPGLTQIFDTTLNSELVKTMRLWPEETGTQGFYIAKVVKN